LKGCAGAPEGERAAGFVAAKDRRKKRKRGGGGGG